MIPIQLKLENAPHNFSTRQLGNQTEIFDNIRKKWIALLPEEWVRQNVIFSLIHNFHVPSTLISIEKGFKINQRQKRFDIVLFDKQIKPAILIECKAFNIPLTQSVFDQMSKYNVHIQAPYILATNGMLSYCCQQNHATKDLLFIDKFPELW